MRVIKDIQFGDRLELVRGPRYDEHISAVESVVSTNLKASPPKVTMSGGSAARRPKRLRDSDRAQPRSATPEAKRPKETSVDSQAKGSAPSRPLSCPSLPRPPPPPSHRHPPTPRPPPGLEAAGDQNTLLHFLCKATIDAIYAFLSGSLTQQPLGIFAKKRRRRTFLFLQTAVAKHPQRPLHRHVVAGASDLLRHRTAWGWYNKRTWVAHPICQTDEVGNQKATEVLAHISSEARHIVEQGKALQQKSEEDARRRGSE